MTQLTHSDTASPPAARAPLQAALRDGRWLAGGIWAGVLLALLVTSAVAITAFAEGSLASASTRSFASIAGTPLNNSHAVAVAGLCMAGLEALALFTAWTAFVRATRNLVTAYAFDAGEADEAPAAAEWIADVPYSDARPDEPEPTPKVIIADVIQFVGVAWAIVIVTPAVLLAVTAFA